MHEGQHRDRGCALVLCVGNVGGNTRRGRAEARSERWFSHLVLLLGLLKKHLGR